MAHPENIPKPNSPVILIHKLLSTTSIGYSRISTACSPFSVSNSILAEISRITNGFQEEIGKHFSTLTTRWRTITLGKHWLDNSGGLAQTLRTKTRTFHAK